MATWTSLPQEAKSILVEGVKEEIKGKNLTEVTQWRDEKLVKLLNVINE
jgi:hypothetical protein